MSDKLETFFKFAFGEDTDGFVCIACRAVETKKFEERFFKYPEEKSELLLFIDSTIASYDLWYCPNILSTRQRRKETILACPTAWADLDTCDPALLLVQPSVLIESSPGRYQALWRFKSEISPFDAEDVSRRIAYFHSEDGADKSGWDLTQLLRIPFTYNFKYSLGVTPKVKIVKTHNEAYSVEHFNQYPKVQEYAYTEISFPNEFPDPKDVWAMYKPQVSDLMWQFYIQPPRDDWSRDLWTIEVSLFEAGATREEVFAVAESAACNKYKRDGRSQEYLWREVCRAWQYKQEQDHFRAPNILDIQRPLLTDEEREKCEAGSTFIEDYIDWAKTLSDASWQYHQAGAFILLSSILSGAVTLPTSYAPQGVKPNLWFMLLADTTLTRKTTAMNIAMGILEEIDDNAVLATDGSIEGFLNALASRPNRSSLFLRDEFSGLLDAMNKKDYYAGMAESLTKLYDGDRDKKVLRREVIDIRDPILLLFAGGTKNRVFELLTYEHVLSGFLPRFIFITAEADVKNIKPVGPPTIVSTKEREKIVNYLQELYQHYNETQTIKVGNTTTISKKTWKAELTTEAWDKYNLLESKMKFESMSSIHQDVLMPTFDRLSKSGLKCAVLIAATRMEDHIIVTESDIIRAFYYVEQWRIYTIEVIANIGKTGFEKILDMAVSMIEENPGVPRGLIMRKLKLSSRAAEEVLMTLDQRGLINRKKIGRAELVYPVEE